MKKIKNILFMSFLACVFSIGITNAKAQITTYSTYKIGDEITVKLNDSTQSKFYVVEDSTNIKKSVNAISADYLDDNLYTFSEANQKLNELKTTWSNVKEISLPNTDLFQMDFELKNETEKVPFDKFNQTWLYPKNGTNNSSYWFSNSLFDGAHIILTLDEKSSDETNVSYTASSIKDTEKARLLPVITVDKENIEGNKVTNIELEDNVWEKFLQNLINNYADFYLLLGVTDYNLDISNDSLKFSTIDSSEIVSYKYSNGILSYTMDEPLKNVENMTDDEFYDYEMHLYFITHSALCSIKSFSDINGYDFHLFSDWLDSKDSFNIEKDGVEYGVAEITKTTDISTGTFTFITGLKLDLKNGSKTYDPSKVKFDSKDDKPSNDVEDKVENPKTSIVTISAGAITLFCLGAILYIKVRKQSKFPQSL